MIPSKFCALAPTIWKLFSVKNLSICKWQTFKDICGSVRPKITIKIWAKDRLVKVYKKLTPGDNHAYNIVLFCYNAKWQFNLSKSISDIIDRYLQPLSIKLKLRLIVWRLIVWPPNPKILRSFTPANAKLSFQKFALPTKCRLRLISMPNCAN